MYASGFANNRCDWALLAFSLGFTTLSSQILLFEM
jgi:hypothetical protein